MPFQRLDNLERKEDWLENVVLEMARNQLRMAEEVKELAKNVEVLVEDMLHHEVPSSSSEAEDSEHIHDNQQSTAILPANTQGCHSALLVGGDYKGDWAPLVRVLYATQVLPSFIPDDLGHINALGDPGSFDLVFLSTRLDPNRSYSLQKTFRRLYPLALLIGVGADPERAPLDPRVISISGFDVLISPNASAAEIRDMIDRQASNVHTMQFYPSGGPPLFSMDLEEHVAPNLFFMSPSIAYTVDAQPTMDHSLMMEQDDEDHQ